MKGNTEEYLDNLLHPVNGKAVRERMSARQYLVEYQDDIPLIIITAYLDSVKERAYINDGRIIGFKPI